MRFALLELHIPGATGWIPIKLEHKMQQDGQQPPAYFRPPILLKMLFKRMKAFFFQKYFLHIFSKFSKFEIFLIFFCKKTSQLRWKRHFEEIISFDTHSTEKLTPLSISKRTSFFKETQLFNQKTQLLYVFEKSYNLSRILRHICHDLQFEIWAARTIG